MKRDLLLGRCSAVLVASVLLYLLARNFVKSNKKSMRRKAHDTGAASAGSDSYDVFLSFRGKDTRFTFTDHLHKGLVEAGIRAFRDDNEIPKGEKLDTNLFQAIKNSKISIPILSPNYAASKWCLEELVEMIERIKSGHVVLPIFYHVEPTHVRNQKGKFGEAFSRLSSNFVKEDVAKWKQALQEVASLKGWEPKKTADGHEAELVEIVIKDVLRELRNAFQLVVTKEPVGIDNAVEDILRSLDDNPGAAQIVGIHGMGGIGKTTLAKFVYNKLLDQFQYRSFIEIRESSQHNATVYWQNQLISDLKGKDQVANMDHGIKVLEDRFKNKKVLILLDDANDKVLIKALIGKHNWFGKGSKIIITTRISSVLDYAGVNYKYELKEIAPDKSLILFSRHAFRRDSPLPEFESLSRDVVSIVGGLPLALEIIGSSLYRQKREAWQEELKKLQNAPHKGVREKLMISYNTLENKEREIFLDIACFFLGADLRYASYMWDAYGFYSSTVIKTLSSMSLIKIGDHGELKMHDQLRDLGRYIVCQEDLYMPRNRSRLWVHEEALEVLQRNEGIQKDHVQALCLDKDWMKTDLFVFSSESEREFTTEQFETLPNLRFLTVCRAKLIGDSRRLLPNLRWLMWRGCPAFVATSFCVEKLVILDLSGSIISEHWEGWNHLKMAKQLKVLDLRYCNYLKVTPSLSNFRKLQIFRLEACANLKQIHHSIGEAEGLVFLDFAKCYELQELPKEMGKLVHLKELYISETAIVKIPPYISSLKKLEVLDAACCMSLVELPDSIGHLENLSTLNLRSCHMLRELPKSIGCLVKLQYLSCGFLYKHWQSSMQERLNSPYAGICELPEFIGVLENLKILSIRYLIKLTNLPSTLSKLGNLEELDATGCENLEGEIHIDGLSSLKILRLSQTSVFGFHGTFNKLSRLEKLELDNCHKLQSLPELPASLTVLKVTGRHYTFPQLSHLIYLKKLIVKDCPLLELMPELPSGLLKLSVTNCGELKELPSLLNLVFLSKLYLHSCGELTEIKGLEGLKSLAGLLLIGCWKLSNLDGLEHLESLRSLRLGSLKDDQVPGLEKLKSLEYLAVDDCQSLVGPDVSKVTHLVELCFRGCHNLHEIKGIERLKDLEILVIEGCPSIGTLPNLERLKNLRTLVIEGCPSIGTLPNLSCFDNLDYVKVYGCSNIPNVHGRLQYDEVYGCPNIPNVHGQAKSDMQANEGFGSEPQHIFCLPSNFEDLTEYLGSNSHELLDIAEPQQCDV